MELLAEFKDLPRFKRNFGEHNFCASSDSRLILLLDEFQPAHILHEPFVRQPTFNSFGCLTGYKVTLGDLKQSRCLQRLRTATTQRNVRPDQTGSLQASTKYIVGSQLTIDSINPASLQITAKSESMVETSDKFTDAQKQ